jgi:hypothetical protein
LLLFGRVCFLAAQNRADDLPALVLPQQPGGCYWDRTLRAITPPSKSFSAGPTPLRRDPPPPGPDSHAGGRPTQLERCVCRSVPSLVPGAVSWAADCHPQQLRQMPEHVCLHLDESDDYASCMLLVCLRGCQQRNQCKSIQQKARSI